jgi:hypothetical protein
VGAVDASAVALGAAALVAGAGAANAVAEPFCPQPASMASAASEPAMRARLPRNG